MGGEAKLRMASSAVQSPPGQEIDLLSANYARKKLGERRRRSKNKSTTSSCARRSIFLIACCCSLCAVTISFLFGVLLILSDGDGVEEDFVDRGRDLGGKRPILPSDLRLAKLTCADHGGPSDELAQEMVYWQQIESDLHYKSPFLDEYAETRYMTFEPDGGGFNNIRMAMETVLAMAHAMGRTLVLPPQQEMYLLYDDKNINGTTQRSKFDFYDFFPMDEISKQLDGLEIITMEEFLLRQGITGKLRDRETNEICFPPNNRTNWNGDTAAVTEELNPWLEKVAFMSDWSPDKCMAAFPVSRDPDDVTSLQLRVKGVENSGGFPPFQNYIGRPTPVYAEALDRLAENLNGRSNLCIYNNTMAHELIVHFHGKVKWGGRLLVHFYSFLFFEDWRQDLWTKRFVRDHIRYIDEIQCSAARIVAAVRERARQRNHSNTEGAYDSFHVRRGEFQYKKTRVSAKEMYEISKDQIPEGATVYMATDERRKDFFDDMAEHYDVVYLSDFAEMLEGVNTNFYGMIDQLVASRSRVFFGCWFST